MKILAVNTESICNDGVKEKEIKHKGFFFFKKSTRFFLLFPPGASSTVIVFSIVFFINIFC